MMRFLTPSIGGLVFSIGALAGPTTSALKSIKTVELQDPTRGGAMSFLDLDTGKRFTFAESSPEDFEASNRWLTKSGADLMAESRTPVHGFIAHDAVLEETESSLEALEDYDAVRLLLDSVEPERFRTIDAVVKRTFIFRTREGAIGGLEAAPSDDADGIVVRYRVLQPSPSMAPIAARSWIPFGASNAAKAQKARLELQKLQQEYPTRNSAIVQAQKNVAFMEVMAERERRFAHMALDQSRAARQRFAAELITLSVFGLEETQRAYSLDAAIPHLNRLIRIQESFAEEVESATTKPAR